MGTAAEVLAEKTVQDNVAGTELVHQEHTAAADDLEHGAEDDLEYNLVDYPENDLEDELGTAGGSVELVSAMS